MLSCGGCDRLRHESKFDLKMIMKRGSGYQDLGMHRGGKNARLMFCCDCGNSDLAQNSRVRLGAMWYDEAESLA